MDLINDKLSKIYLKYLTAAFGSAFMGSVFGLVDMVMVGQYHGPEWWAMPIAEAVTAVYVTASIVLVQKAFQKP